MANDVHTGFIENTLVNGIAVAVATGDSLYVTTTGQIYATGTGGIGINGVSSTTVTIAGQVFGDTAIRMEQNTVNDFIGRTVSVLDGGIVTGDIYGVQMLGYGNTVTIAGQVFGDYGIWTGQIDGLGGSAVMVVAGGVVSGDNVGVQMLGSYNTVTIAGQVSGGGAIEIGEVVGFRSTVSVLDGGIVSGINYGVHMLGDENTVLNDGTISGGVGIWLEGDFSSIVNTGTILGNTQSVLGIDAAVWLQTTAGTTSLVNEGVISSADLAILCLGLAADKVVNQGTIIGRIDLGEGNDRLVNNGAIVGLVELSLGDDTYDGRLGTIEGDVLGEGGNDRLLGGVGAETFYGGIGSDTLKGYGGDDSYWVDSSFDFVSEVGGKGDDTIITTVSLDLTATNKRGDIENVTLSGAGKLNAFGDGLDNELTGDVGTNLLDGRTGADRLTGMAGDDIYVVDNLGDVVDEAAGSGIDTVRSSITFSLAASARMLGLVENIELTGTAAVSATGNTSANSLTGNVAANLLTGAGGADTFRFVTALTASNADTITDFDVVTDRIALDNAVMRALGGFTGALSAAQFWSSLDGLAHDADDRVIYDTDGGFLWYDADGNGAGAALRLANLSASLALTAADFTII